MRSNILYIACLTLMSSTVLAAAIKDEVGEDEEALNKAFKIRGETEEGYLGLQPSYYNYQVHNVPAIPRGHQSPFSVLKALAQKGFFNQPAPSLPRHSTMNDVQPSELNYLPQEASEDEIQPEVDLDRLQYESSPEQVQVDVNLRDSYDAADPLLQQPPELLSDYAEGDKAIEDDTDSDSKSDSEDDLMDDQSDKDDLEDVPLHPPVPLAHTQEEKDKSIHAVNSMADVYFLAVVTGCSIAGVVGLIVAGVCWYRLQKNVKAASDVDYPAYGVTGPTKDRVTSPSERKLAQSAQMYHYQHQKQQMIAMEKAQGELTKDGSEVDSEEENEEGDYTVFECPGLAPTGEMEVKNPLFSEDTPVTPGGDTHQHK